jgi:hypothetical protein
MLGTNVFDSCTLFLASGTVFVPSGTESNYTGDAAFMAEIGSATVTGY